MSSSEMSTIINFLMQSLPNNLDVQQLQQIHQESNTITNYNLSYAERQLLEQKLLTMNNNNNTFNKNCQ
jgi:hypothetical protein